MSILERPADVKAGVPVTPEIFADHPDAKFWIGRVATGNVIDRPDYFDGVARLRAKVYVGEMQFLSPAHVDVLGRELDEDDARSVHLAVVENGAPESPGEARIVGSGRIIAKNKENEPLPIETYFPEVFEGNPLEVGSVEVSRFIARHEVMLTQHTISLSLIRAITHNSVDAEVKADYCIIEKPLLRLLKGVGVPIDILGTPKPVEEPGGIKTLYPVRINPYEVLKSVQRDITGTILLRKFFEEEVPNKGEGFYDGSLTGGVAG